MGSIPPSTIACSFQLNCTPKFPRGSIIFSEKRLPFKTQTPTRLPAAKSMSAKTGTVRFLESLLLYHHQYLGSLLSQFLSTQWQTRIGVLAASMIFRSRRQKKFFDSSSFPPQAPESAYDGPLITEKDFEGERITLGLPSAVHCF